MRRALWFVPLAVLAVLVIGVVVMLLWNWLVPALFGLPTVGFLQAIGLLVLARLLLGGFRAHAGRFAPWRARMMERWAQMSDDERAQFRAAMRARCHGRHGAEEHAHHAESPHAQAHGDGERGPTSHTP